MDTKAYILDLLARGAAQIDAARLAGVSASYISQLCSAQDFAAELESKRAACSAEKQNQIAKEQAIHSGYLNLEQKTIARLDHELPMLRPMEKIKLLAVLATKKAPQALPEQHPSITQTVVQISMPNIVARQFIMNESKAVIGIASNGEPDTIFAPLSSKALREQAAILAETQQNPNPRLERDTRSAASGRSNSPTSGISHSAVLASPQELTKAKPQMASPTAQLPSAKPQIQSSSEIMNLFALEPSELAF